MSYSDCIELSRETAAIRRHWPVGCGATQADRCRGICQRHTAPLPPLLIYISRIFSEPDWASFFWRNYGNGSLCRHMSEEGKTTKTALPPEPSFNESLLISFFGAECRDPRRGRHLAAKLAESFEFVHF